MSFYLIVAAFFCAVGFPLLRRRLTMERSVSIISVTVAVVLTLGAVVSRPVPNATGNAGLVAGSSAAAPAAPPPTQASVVPTTSPPTAAAITKVVLNGDRLIVVDGLLLPEDGYRVDRNATPATIVMQGDHLRVHGWALDSRTKHPGKNVVLITAGSVPVVASYLDDPRPDVAAAVGDAQASRSEYMLDLDTSGMSRGLHTFHIAVQADDGYVVSAKNFAFTVR